MRRVLSLTIVFVTALLLQTTIFSEIQLFGAKPQLLYLVTIVIAMIEGPRDGAIVGFAGGMAQDFLLNQPKGITALTLTLVGYSIGMARQYIVTPSPLLPTMLVAAGTFAGTIFYGAVRFLLGQPDLGMGHVTRVALLAGLYGAILTPLFYPVIRRLSESSRTRRVVRW
jgi:rod shape-determining protein MreD